MINTQNSRLFRGTHVGHTLASILVLLLLSLFGLQHPALGQES